MKDIGKQIIKITGVNIFENTRLRRNVELRALVCFVLRNELNYGLQKIAQYFKDNGKSMHHATVIHLINKYPLYVKYNSDLQELEDCLGVNKSKLKYKTTKIANKYAELKDRYNYLNFKYSKLKKQLESAAVNILHDIPEDKLDEVIERVELIKKSWQWKSQDRCEIIQAHEGISSSVY